MTNYCVDDESTCSVVCVGGSEQVKKSEVEAGGHRLGTEANFSAGFEVRDGAAFPHPLE